MHKQLDSVIYPRSSYYGGLTVEYLAYNAGLQEISQKIADICALESEKKISAEQAYEEIKNLWAQFKQNQSELGIELSSSAESM